MRPQIRPLPAPTAPDLALAVALVVFGVLDVDDRLDATVTASLLLTSLPLAWRRTAPLTALAIVACGFVVQLVPDDPPEPLAQLVPMLVMPYSVAVYARGRRWLAGPVVAVAAGMAEALLARDGDALFIVILVLTAWGAGAVVRRRQHRSTVLEADAERLRERAAEAAAEERERIARELHDVVSHSVSLMVVQAAVAEQTLRTDPGAAERALGALQHTGREAVDDLRRMLGLLRGPAPEHVARTPQPGLAALDDLVGGLRAAGVPVRLVRDGRLALPPGLDLAAYRIVQEGLTNAAKHAPGRSTEVCVRSTAGRLRLEVRTVRPPRGTGDRTGHGLAGMRERVALYGGELDAGFDANEDFVVRASLPVPP